MPPALRPLADYPWAAAAGFALTGLVLLFTAGQLIGGAARARRAEQLGSREELRIALHSVGSFFRSTVLTLLLGLLFLCSGLLHHYRPWQKAEPPAPAPVKEKEKERVTI